MKANELRIGNWITDFEDDPMLITGIKDGRAYNKRGFSTIEDCCGIHLTPEILEKAGFKNAYAAYHDNIFIMNLHGKDLDFQYNSEYDKGMAVSYKKEDNAMVFPCQYLHQLQNLYFSLTGSELEIVMLPASVP